MSIRLANLYTAGHAHRVVDLAEAIGKELGLDASTMQGLRLSALMHNIGKIAIPAELLTKPIALSVWEMALIKSHGEVGYEVLSEIDFPWPVAKAVHQHHERLDGSGYLQGLEGDAIILEARILAVAYTVEAKITNHPYRFAKGLVEALEVVSAGKNTLFDGVVVEACLALFREKDYSFPQSLTRHGGSSS